MTTQDVLRDTASAFGSSGAARGTDAIVVSGDLTNYGKEDGYAAFDALLQLLSSSLPNERIVVVPGNHDVDWGARPSTNERYRHWLRYVREKGFVTPLLNGVDYNDNGELLPDHPNRRPVLVGEDFVLVALNSSNFCGVLEGASHFDWDAAMRFKVVKRAAMRTAITALRQHDVARISSEQIRALRTWIEDNQPDLLERDADPRVRIAVLHHHLLPVSADEEIKTFESIVDLGITRMFLRDFGFHVVLHGHKHRPGAYFDYPADPQHPLRPGQRRMLVLAAPGLFRHGELAFRILDVRPRARNPRGSRPYVGSAPLIDVRDVRGLRPSETFASDAPATIEVWRSDMERAPEPFTAIYGETREDVYERLQSAFENISPGAEIANLLCVVRSPKDADENTVPSGYPAVAEVDEESWFRSLVDWWQAPSSHALGQSGATAFNHGQRIYGRRWGLEFDAVQRAADLLHEKHDTTRSIAVLVDPCDEAGHPEIEFPAFVLVQLRLVVVDRRIRLDCLGYFRKHDIRHWWPVNVAELTRMQNQALRRLRRLGTHAERGHVITFAAAALIDEDLPSLDIARIDRALDDEKDKKQLWLMAYAVFHPTEPSGAEATDLWERMLSDLDAPASDPGTARKIATVGLDELHRRLSELQAVSPSTGCNEIVQFVGAVRSSFRDLDDASKTSNEDAYARAAARLDEDLPKLRAAAKERLDNPRSG